MKNFVKLCFMFILILLSSIIINVSAESNISIGVYSPQKGMRLCAKSNVFSEGTPHMYGWFTLDNERALSAWPGELLVRDANGNYCYDVVESDQFDMAIFNNDLNAQTIDLSTIKDSGNIINSYLYIFNNMDNGRYVGKWYVYDNSAITNLVDDNSSKLNDRFKYTKASYNNFKTYYNASSNIVNEQNPYSSTSAYVIHRDDSLGYAVYSSEYINTYNNLVNASDGLVKRGNIIIADDITGGSVNASYVDTEEDADYIVGINYNAAVGHKLSYLKAFEITNFEDGEPVLGNEMTVSNTDNNNYVIFDENEASSIKGVYIDGKFSKKVYKIKFKIDKNGKVTYIKDGSEFEVDDVVYMEHGSNFLAKVIANAGYTFKSATVNGSDVSIDNNSFRIDNIDSDQEVEIMFTLKTYKVTIDDNEFTLAHGTTYKQLLELINTNKEGYNFIGLTDKNKKRISKDFIVEGDIQLYTLFEKKDSIINPETGINILRLLVIFGITISLLYIGGKEFEKKKVK